jgi:hypothetical protein
VPAFESRAFEATRHYFGKIMGERHPDRIFDPDFFHHAAPGFT